ncbi:MAG: hypothetical protein K6C05_03415 [Anaerovibrio sp.]|uniref:hypothetical protein n=1 Tax=Anaerovibrio sp. TaxID=1872532 RepID=UPI0025EC7B61|nr:hypothetical protein [Anaerovibrio sp.]MCR5175881.1 hypothetical protein [Anaerovibrio sp.]
MTKEAIEAILKEKIAVERSKLPTHEYIDLNAVSNGRGVADAGLLYIQAVDTALDIMSKSLAGALSEIIKD